MGSLFGGSTKTKSTSDPWAPQGDALKDIFKTAGDFFKSKQGSDFFTGDLYAQMDPQTAQAIQAMLGHIRNKGENSANAVTGAGADLLDSAKGGYADAMEALKGAMSGDRTAENIAAATAYSNNPAINGMIDAASRDVSRNLYENELPGINRAAAGTGNVNSSRAGVADGIAMRGAQDMIGDISANIRGNAFDRGLALAEQGRATDIAARSNMAGLYGNAMGQGFDAIGQGNSMSLGNFGAAVDASSLFQKDRQGQMDADFARWQGQDTRDLDLLDRYMGVVGAQNWGGTTKSKQKSSGSILGSALGIGSMVAGFSDRRLKENIVKTGELEDGLGVYDFDYIWGEKASGVMADEVAELRPWALGPVIAGFRTVNYAAL